MHLWLHNPQSAWMLLSSKMVVAFGAGIVVIVLNGIGMYTFFSVFSLADELLIFRSWLFYAYTGIGLLVISSYLAVWFMFGQVVFHAVKRFIGKLSLLVTLAFIVGIVTLLYQIGTSEWLFQLAHWTGFSVKLPLGFEGPLTDRAVPFSLT